MKKSQNLVAFERVKRKKARIVRIKRKNRYRFLRTLYKEDTGESYEIPFWERSKNELEKDLLLLKEEIEEIEKLIKRQDIEEVEDSILISQN